MYVKSQDATNANQISLKRLSNKFRIITTKEKKPTWTSTKHLRANYRSHYVQSKQTTKLTK
jgi:hypothetical protein